MQDTRLNSLKNWLKTLPNSLKLDMDSISPASSDASFRRYFRVMAVDSNLQSFIVMDAPPDKEDSSSFIKIGKLLFEKGINVPNIIEINSLEGFLLLSDLGNTTYLSIINPENATQLYRDAIHALVEIQTKADSTGLPTYDESLLLREMNLFTEWYLSKHLQYAISPSQTEELHQIFSLLNQNILAQPRVFVHRDYHSRNLMVTPHHNPGILDFQDAVHGPITYDLISLFRDAYIEWDEEQQMDWIIRYWEAARKAKLPVQSDFGDFYKDVEWMGLQRHLKVLGIFARLYHRDGKDGYLKDLPLVLKYTEKVAQRYIGFKPLVRILDATHQIQRPDGYTF